MWTILYALLHKSSFSHVRGLSVLPWKLWISHLLPQYEYYVLMRQNKHCFAGCSLLIRKCRRLLSVFFIITVSLSPCPFIPCSQLANNRRFESTSVQVNSDELSDRSTSRQQPQQQPRGMNSSFIPQNTQVMRIVGIAFLAKHITMNEIVDWQHSS